MKVGYVVLYIKDAELCRKFWLEQVGMVEKNVTQAGPFKISKVGFANQDFAFELVPLDLMKDNPYQLNLGTPSICFFVDNLEATRTRLVQKGVTVTEISDHAGKPSFAFSDPEERWFAVSL